MDDLAAGDVPLRHEALARIKDLQGEWLIVHAGARLQLQAQHACCSFGRLNRERGVFSAPAVQP